MSDVSGDGQRYVWIVFYDNYGDTWLSEVFDSEEKAKAYEEERDPKASRRYEWQRDYRIEKRAVS
jgi:hypothetical protein